MIRLAIALAIGAGLAGPHAARAAEPSHPSAPHPSTPHPITTPAQPSPPAPARPAPVPFAAELAAQPLPPARAAWTAMSEQAAWAALATATPATRQATRWRYAVALIARDRAGEALGVLDVMAADDTGLAKVAAWRRARGVALGRLGRTDPAIAALDDPALATDPETCLWRMRILAEAGRAAPALGVLGCAMPALNARGAKARRPFILAAARAAIDAGRPGPARDWLDRLPATAVLHGEADRALGAATTSRRWFDLAARTGDPEQRAAATLGTIETDLAARMLAPPAAARRLAALLFRWRGGMVERRGLTLAMSLATRRGDEPALLAAAAALLRYGNIGADAAPLSATVQAHLVALVAPQSTMPLGTAAGLLWDYRDLMPTGADGDRVVWMLADRLQQAGLYRRAAELLERRLSTTQRDVEQGPLSIRVATLRILAGAPDAAVRVLRETAMIPYPDAIQDERRRLQAVALELLGRHAEAVATLADIRDATPIRAEFDWHARDWSGLAASGTALLPAPGARGGLSAEGQAIVLRQAIAHAMLGQEAALARLNRRYARAFAPLPTAPVFAMLTAPVGGFDPARLDSAMTALSATGPAGAIGDLLTAGQAARTSTRLD